MVKQLKQIYYKALTKVFWVIICAYAVFYKKKTDSK